MLPYLRRRVAEMLAIERSDRCPRGQFDDYCFATAAVSPDARP